MEYFNIMIAISFAIAIIFLLVLLFFYVQLKKDKDELEKDFRYWKEGRKKTLFEQAGIYPPETIATLTEENRRLQEELEKYKKLYSDGTYEQIHAEQYWYERDFNEKRKLIARNIYQILFDMKSKRVDNLGEQCELIVETSNKILDKIFELD